MSETDKSALVPRLHGALEKAEPRRRRILSGMVADTLALVRKATPSKPRPLRIMVVDDDPDLLDIYREIFLSWFSTGEILTFHSPLTALRKLEQLSPDLLITGVKMPQLDGYELIERLLLRNIKYPIVVLTAFGPAYSPAQLLEEKLARQWEENHARRGVNVRYHEKSCGAQALESLRRSIEETLHISRGLIETPVATERQLNRLAALEICKNTPVFKEDLDLHNE